MLPRMACWLLKPGVGLPSRALFGSTAKGKELGAVGKPDVYGNVSVAPNGNLVSISITDIASQNTDIWTYDLQRGNTKRLTFNPAQDAVPIWSPDAARLVFASNRRDFNDLYVKNSDGAQEEQNILQSDADKFPNDWSPEGRYILYTQDTDFGVVTLPELKSSLFLKASSVVRNGQFSP